MQKETYHAPWLDWLRFLAAALVCAAHIRNFVWTEWGALAPDSRHLASFALIAIARFGHEAVIVFFVLSGFLVGGRCIQDWRERHFDVRRFAANRFSRIYPPYFAALILTLLVSRVAPGLEPSSPGNFVAHLAFLQGPFVPVVAGNSPLWSIAYETWFYVLAAACLLVCDNGRLSRLLGGAALLALSIGWLVKGDLVYLVCWLAGALACSEQTRLRANLPAFVGLGLVLIGAALHQAGRDSASFQPPVSSGRLWQDFGVVLLAIGLALGLPRLASLHPRSPSLQWLDRLGTRLAAFSYSLYLIHQPLIDLSKLILPERVSVFDVVSCARFALLLAFCLLAAWAFGCLFEGMTPRLRRLLLAPRSRCAES